MSSEHDRIVDIVTDLDDFGPRHAGPASKIKEIIDKQKDLIENPLTIKDQHPDLKFPELKQSKYFASFAPGPWDKSAAIAVAKNADEEHDVLSISGRREFSEGVRSLRCGTLTLQEGAHIVMNGGRIADNNSPESDLIVIAAKKLVIRTPNPGAIIEIKTGDARPAPPKAQNGAHGNGGVGVGVGGDDADPGTDGTHGSVPGIPLMKQVVLVFDEIDVTDPNDPNNEYPKLKIIARGENGRNGGEGGDGGDGGNGSKGSKSVTEGNALLGILWCAAGPGPGGDGGNGGDAGRGGDAENGIQGHNVFLMCTQAGHNKASAWDYDQKGGGPGEPGIAGKPGRRGVGGWEGESRLPCTPADRRGKHGHPGRENDGGAKGKMGPYGRVFDEILTQTEFDDIWT